MRTCNIYRIRRAFLWADSDKFSSGKFKINWEVVYRFTTLGGLRVLNLEKFARVLGFHWPWVEWTTPGSTWVGTSSPCNTEDMGLFYTFTAIAISDDNITSFGKPLGRSMPLE